MQRPVEQIGSEAYRVGIQTKGDLKIELQDKLIGKLFYGIKINPIELVATSILELRVRKLDNNCGEVIEAGSLVERVNIGE